MLSIIIIQRSLAFLWAIGILPLLGICGEAEMMCQLGVMDTHTSTDLIWMSSRMEEVFEVSGSISNLTQWHFFRIRVPRAPALINRLHLHQSFLNLQGGADLNGR